MSATRVAAARAAVQAAQAELIAALAEDRMETRRAAYEAHRSTGGNGCSYCLRLEGGDVQLRPVQASRWEDDGETLVTWLVGHYVCYQCSTLGRRLDDPSQDVPGPETRTHYPREHATEGVAA